ncbi:hypothetical protein LJC27_01765 [Christensenellaceae bacterium OttesenSCG-928-M15]|nr:hypothetical protein [Christensenellaceae bacterium OttesenSCG-928-M15]
MSYKKEQLLDAFRAIGQLQAQALKERAVDMTGTEIIDAETFVPKWKPVNYTVIGQPVRWEDQVYALKQAHDSTANTGWYPSDDTASLWKRLRTKNPSKAKPYHVAGGHDGYMTDEVCLFDGRVYRSMNDNLVYSPAEYPQGWEEVTE